MAEARRLHDNWVKTRQVYIEEGSGAQDAREFLFSVADLQEFLDYVRAGSEGFEPGIRIYLAASELDGSNKATVFLVPTMGTAADSENNYELQPLNRGVQGWPPKNY